MPQIDDAAQHHKDIPNLMKELGAIMLSVPYSRRIWRCWFRPNFYGLIMQELERGDSAVRSATSVQSSLVMFLFMSLVQKNKNENIFQN